MADDKNDPIRALGELMHGENPYPWDMEIRFEEMVKDGPGRETDARRKFRVTDVYQDRAKILDANFWYFKGKPSRVSKTIRIPYTYVVNGESYTQYLLIGYEGHGGGM